MPKGRDEDKGGELRVAKLFHKFFGVVSLYQMLIVEVAWLFPRTPIGFIFEIVLPKAIKIGMDLAIGDQLYKALQLSHFFDGDGTVTLEIVAIVSIILCGGLSSKVLWPKSRFRRLLTLTLFLFNPLAWTFRSQTIHADMEKLSHDLLQAFGPGKPNQPIYSITNHIYNEFGAKEIPVPDTTVVYKTVKKDKVGCVRHPLLGLGGAVYDDMMETLKQGNLELDIYKPRTKPQGSPLPVVLFIHGGAWDKGHRTALKLFYGGGLPHYLLERGHVIVSVTYRLAGCNNIDVGDQISDVHDATQYVIKHATEWGADAKRVIPFGSSAGGHLAMMLGYKFKIPEIIAIFNYYGVSELRRQEILNYSGFWARFIHGPIYNFITSVRLCTTSADKEACFKDFSPITHVSRESPTTISIHGRDDGIVMIDQTQALDRKLKAHNVTHISAVTHGNHGCDAKVSSPCSQAGLFAISRFLDTQIN